MSPYGNGNDIVILGCNLGTPSDLFESVFLIVCVVVFVVGKWKFLGAAPRIARRRGVNPALITSLNMMGLTVRERMALIAYAQTAEPDRVTEVRHRDDMEQAFGNALDKRIVRKQPRVAARGWRSRYYVRQTPPLIRNP